MNRENTLFAAVGLLLGYAAAFTLVVYLNQAQAPASRGGQAPGAASSGQPMNAVKEQQRLQSEVAQATQKARQEPENFDAQVNAATASFNTGDYEGAIDFLTSANKLRPDHYDTLIMLGQANFGAQRYDVAGRWYADALKRKPEDLDARSELALTYFLRTPRDLDRAVSEFNATLARDPAHEATLHNMTLVYIEMRKFSEAEAALARLEKASPQSERLPMLRERLKEARNSGNSKSSSETSAAGAKKRTPSD